VAVEILARIPWPDGWWWTFLRYCGLVPVALVAAIVSYQHMRGLLIYYGENGWTPTIGPLAVDGLMILATGALIATSPGRRVRTGDRWWVSGPLGDRAEDRTASAGPAEDHAEDQTVQSGPDGDQAPEPAGTAPVPYTADLLLVGRAVAADLARDGRQLTRSALIAGVRSRNHRISTTRATELLRQLRDTA
jgi:hypothetical protein